MPKTNQSKVKIVYPEYSFDETVNALRHNFSYAMDKAQGGSPTDLKVLERMINAVREGARAERVIVLAKAAKRESKGAEKFNDLELAKSEEAQQ